jgi:hypothetical protein
MRESMLGILDSAHRRMKGSGAMCQITLFNSWGGEEDPNNGARVLGRTPKTQYHPAVSGLLSTLLGPYEKSFLMVPQETPAGRFIAVL